LNYAAALVPHEPSIPNEPTRLPESIVRAHAYFLETVHCSFSLGRRPSESLTDFVEAIADSYVRGNPFEVCFRVRIRLICLTVVAIQVVLEYFLNLDSSGAAFGRNGVLGPAGFRLTATEIHYRGASP
jgi:hypothetical protein